MTSPNPAGEYEGQYAVVVKHQDTGVHLPGFKSKLSIWEVCVAARVSFNLSLAYSCPLYNRADDSTMGGVRVSQQVQRS